MTSVNTANTPRLPTIVSVGNIAEYRKNIFSEEPTEQVKGVHLLRQLLSTTYDSQIQLVLDACAIPRLVQFLTAQHNPTLQYEAIIVLRIIAMRNTQQSRRVIDAGAIPVFIQLLSSSSEDVRAQSTRAISILASFSVECRNLVLNHGVLPALLISIESFRENTPLTIIRNAIRTLSNLCRGYPSPNYELVKHALPVFTKLIYSTDIEIVKHASWGVSFLTNESFIAYQVIIDSGIGTRLIELLRTDQLSLQAPALRTIRNFTTGDEIDTQHILDINVLPVLLWLLDHPSNDVCEDTCWTINNLCGGPINRIQAVIDAKIFSKVIELSYIAEYSIQKAITFIFDNIWLHGSIEQIQHLIQLGMISSMCHLLTTKHMRVLKNVLQSLQLLLEIAYDVVGYDEITHLVCNHLFEYNGWNRVEELHNHYDKDINSRAKTMYTTYFNEQDINGGLLK